MTDTLIKICGLSTPQSLQAAMTAGADYAGMVFFGKSPRNVGFDVAKRLADISGSRIRRVGVFVDPDDDLLARAIEAGRLNEIQLHGKESPQRAAEIRRRFGLPIWKAVSVSGPADIMTANAYAEFADRILFDAKTPAGSDLPGGMGLRFDWNLLRGYQGRGAWGLSGGISPTNVANALSITRAPLIDVSSGVESAPGTKDVDKIAAFCKAVRRHDQR